MIQRSCRYASQGSIAYIAWHSTIPHLVCLPAHQKPSLRYTWSRHQCGRSSVAEPALACSSVYPLSFVSAFGGVNWSLHPRFAPQSGHYTSVVIALAKRTFCMAFILEQWFVGGFAYPLGGEAAGCREKHFSQQVKGANRSKMLGLIKISGSESQAISWRWDSALKQELAKKTSQVLCKVEAF